MLISAKLPPQGSAHPQNTLPAWTNAAPRQCASTKYPPSVDKCHPRAVRIHKIPSQCGQMPPQGSAHPQNTLPVWTNAAPRQCASTKYPPSMDNCRSRTAGIHKTAHYRGQLPEPDGRHPQNSPLPWTIAGAGLQTSTK